MHITEEKIRQISRETIRLLGPAANEAMVKKVVKEVVKRLMAEENHTRKGSDY